MCLVSETINPDTADVRNKCIFSKMNLDASQRGIHTQPLLTGFCLANPKNYRTRCRNHFALGLINFMKFGLKTFQ